MLGQRRWLRPINAFGIGSVIVQGPFLIVYAVEPFTLIYFLLGCVALIVGTIRTDFPTRPLRAERTKCRELANILGHRRATATFIARRYLDVHLPTTAPSQPLKKATKREKRKVTMLLTGYGTIHANNAVLPSILDDEPWTEDWRRFYVFDLEIMWGYGSALLHSAEHFNQTEDAAKIAKQLDAIRAHIDWVKQNKPPSRREPKRVRRRFTVKISDFAFGLRPQGMPA